MIPYSRKLMRNDFNMKEFNTKKINTNETIDLNFPIKLTQIKQTDFKVYIKN